MPRTSRRAALPAVLVACALALLTPLALAGPLDSDLNDLLNHIDLGDAQVSVLVMDPVTNRVLASHNPNLALIPASNQKLLTSGAALITLGESFVFRTELLLDGTRLIIRGSGDPGLGDPVLLERSDPPMTVDDLLERLASSVAARAQDGITEIIADDRVFDRQYAHPSWPEKDLNRWYCAEVAGLGFHTNVISVFVSPAPEGPGAAPRVSVQPDAPVYTLNNRARTTTSGANSAWIARPAPANVFTLFGDVRRPALAPIRASIHEPPLFTAGLIRSALHNAGVPVPSNSALRLASDRDQFTNAETVAVVMTALPEVLRRCNTDSHNLYAEALIKRIGYEVTSDAGSWANGAAVIRMLLSERLGPDHASSVHIADGSGMSRNNRVSPATLAAWLDSISDDPALFTPFVDSLAAPGEGTLTSRFKNVSLDNQVRAESGYLTGVYALSGYLIDPTTSRRIVFSMIINEGRRSSGNARRFHEAFVVDIDRWLTKQRPARADALGG